MKELPGPNHGFVHLCVQSYYSFFASTLSPVRIAELAVQHGATTVAMTDTNNLSGAVEFYQAARKSGIQPILGAQVTEPFAHERTLLHARAPGSSPAGDDPFAGDGGRHDERGSASPMLMHGDLERRVILLARNFSGYSQICRLLTRRHLESGFELTAELARLDSDVLILSDCVDLVAWAAKALAKDKRFWAVLTPSRRRRKRNRAIYDAACRHGLPLVVACDVCLEGPDDAPLHDLLQAMRRLTTVEKLPAAERVDPARHFQDEAAIRAFLHVDTGQNAIHADISRAIAETANIAAMCDVRLPIGDLKFPRFPGLTDSPEIELRRRAEAGLKWRYGDPPASEAVQRMNYELGVISQLRFTEYFLMVKRIVEETRRRGYHTIGRGSAANSIITYALGISDVCPIACKLYFERFLNPERTAPPDIDLDLAWDERDSILKWCFEFFGHAHVALISTVQTLRSRQSIREVAKAMGLSEREIGEINRLHETHFCEEENTITGGGAFPRRIRNLSLEKPWRSILVAARRIAGFPHHLSVHCGGIVIAPDEVTRYVPLTSSAKGYAITQMDMTGVEDLGLIKMDLLGNRSLAVLRDAIAMADANPPPCEAEVDTGDTATRVPMNTDMFQREAARIKLAGTRRGTSVALVGVLEAFGDTAPATFPPPHETVRERVFDFELVSTDTATRALIDAGQTMGVFYIESPGMRALFERLRCRNYEDLVAASSIIRPGVAESGMMQAYIDRHRAQSGFEDPRSPTTLLPASAASERLASGTMPINAHSKARIAVPLESASPSQSKHVTIHPLMLELLPDTFGVMIYQEDVLRVAHDLAGMSYAEADLLRRAMSGHMRSSEALNQIQGRFLAGAQARGVAEADALDIWRQIASFAGYSFCKGHSASFAKLSYQIAWLKAHHPAEFFAGVLSNEGGFYGAAAYLEEARRWGIKILPPCVNASEVRFYGTTLELRGMSCDGELRVGLQAILNLSTVTRECIVRQRVNGGPYVSLEDFLSRVPVGMEECRNLARVGALDTLAQPGRSRRGLLLEMDCLMKLRDADGGLFLSIVVGEASPLGAPLSRREACQWELEHMGFMLSGHPMDFVTIPPNVVPARDIRIHTGQRATMAGWLIAAKLLATRNGSGPMKMLTLEDRTGTFEAILFPRTYARFATRTLGRGPFIVTGRVDTKLGSPTLNVTQIALA